MTNYFLYARILRLSYMGGRAGMTPPVISEMDQIVREVVQPAAGLVWC